MEVSDTLECKPAVLALDNFGKEVDDCVIAVRVTMAESRLFKSIAISKHPAERVVQCINEYTEKQDKNLLENVGQPVVQWLLQKGYIREGEGGVLEPVATGSKEKKEKEKAEKDKKKKNNKDDEEGGDEDGDGEGADPDEKNNKKGKKRKDGKKKKD